MWRTVLSPGLTVWHRPIGRDNIPKTEKITRQPQAHSRRHLRYAPTDSGNDDRLLPERFFKCSGVRDENKSL